MPPHAVEELSRPIPLEIMDALLSATARGRTTEEAVCAEAPVDQGIALAYLGWMERRRFVVRQGQQLKVTPEGRAFLADLKMATRHL